MYGVLHIERSSAFNAGTQSNDRQAQGKKARQFHPRQVPLNNELRFLRLPSGGAFLAHLKSLIPHPLAAVCEQYHQDA